MKTFTICIIIAFISLIATMFVMDTRAIFMDPFPISLIVAVCSVIGTIFIMETHPVSINSGVITIKTLTVSINSRAITINTLSFTVKEVYTMTIIAMIGTILTIIVVNNLGVLQ